MRKPVQVVTAALALAALLPAAPPAAGATVTVKALDFEFDPRTRKVAQGTEVRWRNDGDAPHTATRDGILGWDSENLDSGDVFCCETFRFAGGYPYVCEYHAAQDMKGTIKVRVKVSPASGGTGTTFTITVGTVALPSGHRFHVRWRKGMGEWKNLEKSTRDRTLEFTPGSRGPGTYGFKSRVRTDDEKTTWSPVRSVAVS